MHPVLFELGPLTIKSFGVLMLIAFISAAAFAVHRAPRWGITKQEMLDVSFWALLGGVLGARLAYILLNLAHFQENPQELWTLQFQGLTSFGGLIGGAIALVIWCRARRVSILAMLDVAAGPFLLGHIIGRIGCLLNGCCYGMEAPAGYVLAVRVAGHEHLHHPAQAYDSALNILMLGGLLVFERKLRPVGQSFALMIMMHEAVRFLVEFWRRGETAEPLAGLPITQAQAMSLLMIVAALGLFVWRRGGAIREPATPEAG
ncbi:MAG: prolipoprotein diacylglyceryl transferase [Fimbriimonadaceae bacterium]